jgi:DNA-directed RNA polymerase specialized sigma24 family protein
MNREQRLVAAGMDSATAAEIGSLLPAGTVDKVCAALRASHRAGRQHEQTVRRQRRDDRRKHHHIEDDQHAASVERNTLALARRASASLDTLARLSEHYADGPTVLALAVAGLRAEGYSDGEIGAALGVTPAAVGQRFGRKRDLYAGRPGTEGAA